MQTKDYEPSDRDIEAAIAKAMTNLRGEEMNRRTRRLYVKGGRYSEYEARIRAGFPKKEKKNV